MSTYRPGKDSPGDRLIRRLAEDALVAEAEEAAQGVRALTITTGCPETPHEEALVAAVIKAAWAGTPGAQTTSVGGGHDYTTIRIAGSRADEFLDQLADLARQLNPGWWRIATSSHARF